MLSTSCTMLLLICFHIMEVSGSLFSVLIVESFLESITKNLACDVDDQDR